MFAFVNYRYSQLILNFFIFAWLFSWLKADLIRPVNGSEIQYNEEIGIETDGAEPSTLKLYTNYIHGFIAGSSLYFTNTIGSLKYTREETATDLAPDGIP